MSRALGFVFFVLLISSNAFGVQGVEFRGGETFVATIYEHAIILPENRSDVITRVQAVENMDKNLDVFEDVAKKAKNESNILVFPEDAIYGVGFGSHEAIYPYMEEIPQPNNTNPTWCACDVTGSADGIHVQRRLSCMAKENKLYLIANMGDKEKCQTTDPQCPSTGHFNRNTNVVFDPNGCLVAKYHKYNLFLSEPFHRPEIEYSYFDTPFGRFGTFICFDILFKEPAVSLVEKYGIDHIVFPTAWMNVFPLFASIETHQAFAMMMGVNVLSANLHYPQRRFVGSGVYTPQGYGGFTYKPDDPTGQKVTAVINCKPKPNAPYLPIPLAERSHAKAHTFESVMFGDVYSWVPLEKSAGKLSVCQKRVCCHLEYSVGTGFDSTGDLYALGAFDSLHTLEGQYYIQACALVRCASQSRTSCGSSTKVANTTFNRVHLRGELDTKYILPQVLGYPVGLDVGSWSYGNGAIKIEETTEKPLLTAMLFGRWYEKDHGEKLSRKASSASGTMWNILLTRSSLLLGIFWMHLMGYTGQYY